MHRNRHRALAVSFLLVCASCALCSATRAQSPRYQQTIQQAVANFDAGRFAQAKALFLEAHAMAPSARTLRALGMVEFELRHYVDSVSYLERALHSPDKPLDAALRREARSVLARAEQHTAVVEVSKNPADASLTLDGVPILLDAQNSARLDPGEHRLELHARGHESQAQHIVVAAGDRRSLSFTLAPERSDIRRADPAPDDDRAKRKWLRNPWLWAGVSVLVVGTVAGLSIGLTRPDTTHPEKANGGNTNAVLTAP